jgi:hypothetical protein
MAIVCGFPDFHTCSREFALVEELEAHVALAHYSLCVYECEHKVYINLNGG